MLIAIQVLIGVDVDRVCSIRIHLQQSFPELHYSSYPNEIVCEGITVKNYCQRGLTGQIVGSMNMLFDPLLHKQRMLVATSFHSHLPLPAYLAAFMKKIHLKRKIAPRISNGHPWIFANEVEKMEGDPADGQSSRYIFMTESLLAADILTAVRRS